MYSQYLSDCQENGGVVGTSHSTINVPYVLIALHMKAIHRISLTSLLLVLKLGV